MNAAIKHEDNLRDSNDRFLALNLFAISAGRTSPGAARRSLDNFIRLCLVLSLPLSSFPFQ